ncbi:MAG TPA: Hpt domain-containing protein, partial [Casimicrobiaceae bacterium]|nr:Hpt domain-containing protein [Casimicrobiaceae bacterium]
EELPAADVPAAVGRVDHAIARLRVFLADVAGGAPPVPLALFPEYEAMQKARGMETAAPTDLFYPDLNVRAPRSTPSEIMPAARLASHLLKERRQYQRGLLEWLRGADGGAAAMRDAIAAIEEVTPQPALRAFWWTAVALLEALAHGALPRSFGAKQLVARIDMQIRRVTEGSAKVADRLRREVLYHVATAKPATPQIELVQRTYHLAALIPTPEALDSDVVRLQPLLREAREQLAHAKDAWLKAASGRTDTLPKLAQLVASANGKAAELKHPALSRLMTTLTERLAAMPPEGASEPLAMEFATALLLAESAFENFNNLSPEFATQVDAMIARLDAARAGRTATDAAPALDEMSRRAQERALLAQVMREVRANLRHMEQVLDAFFRDHTRRTELAGLAKDSQQIRGALKMLELDDADRLLALCQAQIETYADPGADVDEEGLELLAESLSGLGFYIDAVLHQRPDRDRIIAPLIAKRLGETPQPAVTEPQSVEDSVAELRAALPRLMADVRHAPADGDARAELRGKLVSLRDDAELIGDADLVAQANAALRQIDGGESAALAASVDLIVESGAAPAPAISEETQRLLDTDASGLDAELLDIYLAEADEVLETVAEQKLALEHNPGDREALVTVRRQFHTLKGSGRMVGLTELGELAWNVERVHNRLLEEERRVTPAVIALIGIAQESFRHWVQELRETGRFATDPAPLAAALRAVEAELPGSMPLPPVPAAAPVKPIPVATDAPIGPIPKPPVAPATGMGAGETFTSFAAPDHPPTEYPAAASALPGTPGADHDATPPDVHREAATRAPDLELVDFPELGSAPEEGDQPSVTVIEQSLGETIDVGVPADRGDPVKPVLRVVADNSAAHAGTSDARARTHAHPHSPGLTLLTDAARESDLTPAMEADDVTVGSVTLSAALWRILCDEADQNVAVLQHEVSVLQFDPDHMPVEAMVRASHTLCGIHRTGGITLIATTARALEQALLALEERGAPFPSTAQPVLARATAGLAHFVSRVKGREGFTPSDEREALDIATELEEMRKEALADVPAGEPLLPPEAESAEAPGADASAIAAETAGKVAPDPGVIVAEAPSVAGTVAEEPAVPLVDFPPLAGHLDDATTAEHAVDTEPSIGDAAAAIAAAFVPPAAPPTRTTVPDESLLDVADDVDETILPIFLEEVGELFPQAGEGLRAWRRTPDDASCGAQLRRTLHTLKGSARMAGAMRLGELAHRMESRLTLGDTPVAPSGELFEALDTDL